MPSANSSEVPVGQGYSRSARSDEHVEVYARMQGGDMTGLLVLNAEPRELTIIHLDGTVRPEDLASLSGRVGSPKMRIRGIL